MNSLQNNIFLRKENLSQPTQDVIDLYREIFFKNATGHIYKYPGETWFSSYDPPTDQDIIDHLTGKKHIGPRYHKKSPFGILDFDNKSQDQSFDFCDIIGATPANSMLANSPSKGGFHLNLRYAPIDSPISIYIALKAFESYPKKLLCGAHPMQKQGIRAPFGKDQELVYDDHQHLVTVKAKLECFLNLDIFELRNVKPYDHKNYELFPDLPEAPRRIVIPVLTDISPRGKSHRDKFRLSHKEVSDLKKTGLTEPGTRDLNQFKLICDEYRQEHSEKEATRNVCEFIRDHNNGLSKDYNHDHNFVFTHIAGQVKRTFKHLKERGILPLDIHCSEHEFLSFAYIIFALDHGHQNWPVTKLLTKDIAYYSSRKHRELVRIPCAKMKIWSDKNFYLKLTNTFLYNGTGKRGTAYFPKHLSKYLMLNLPESNEYEAIYFHGRRAKTLEEAIRGSCTPAEARKLLRDSGFTMENSKKIVQRIYNSKRDKTGTDSTERKGERE